MKTYDMDKLPSYKLGYYTKGNEALRSSWPDHENVNGWSEPTKAKVPAPCWYIDNRHGISVSKCDTLKEAKNTLHACGGKQAGYTLRYYETSLKEMHNEAQERKQDFRLGWRP